MSSRQRLQWLCLHCPLTKLYLGGPKRRETLGTKTWAIVEVSFCTSIPVTMPMKQTASNQAKALHESRRRGQIILCDAPRMLWKQRALLYDSQVYNIRGTLSVKTESRPQFFKKPLATTLGNEHLSHSWPIEILRKSAYIKSIGQDL